MTITMTLDEAINNYPRLVNELTYSCYKYNRDISPNTTPEQWETIFGDTKAMEERYQKEKGK